ncbi:rRNA pseudouridine synthase [Candidatus Saccharibacteria bacterium]|nr:rRNA pseudouridine synthase [Candidatus Saccharibacteria bacterium]
MDNQQHQFKPNNQQPQPELRLNKFLAERLGVSRREADEAISAGKVTINGEKAILGARINRENIDKNLKVCYNGKIVPFETVFLYLAFNKPVGYVCSRRAQGSAPTIYESIPKKYQHLKTVGRLDKDSSGLILLTNDGDFAFKMTHPKFRKNKVYEVELDRPLEPLHQQMITDYGIALDDGPSRFKIIKKLEELPFEDRKLGRAPSSVSEKGNSQASYIVILSEGRNRQIRRTFAALGYQVTKLHRTNFGKYELGNLEPGKYAIIKP